MSKGKESYPTAEDGKTKTRNQRNKQQMQEGVWQQDSRNEMMHAEAKLAAEQIQLKGQKHRTSAYRSELSRHS